MNEGSQWDTPAWAAQELWRQKFGWVTAADRVLEPTCGIGRMLQAVPSHIPAIGIEIDEPRAVAARACSGREVIVGDIVEIELPRDINVVFGNPPFRSKFVRQMMDRFVETYSDGCQCGLIIPAYFLQTPSTVVERWNRNWTISVELLPRTLFPEARNALFFAMFTKDPVPSLNGMRLYVEALAIEKLPIVYRTMLEAGTGLWRQVVEHAVLELGGKAHLNDIYAKVGGRRPTPNTYWREKVRQTLQRGPFVGHGHGVWEANASRAA